jgi:hypothetical protein
MIAAPMARATVQPATRRGPDHVNVFIIVVVELWRVL